MRSLIDDGQNCFIGCKITWTILSLLYGSKCSKLICKTVKGVTCMQKDAVNSLFQVIVTQCGPIYWDLVFQWFGFH